MSQIRSTACAGVGPLALACPGELSFTCIQPEANAMIKQSAPKLIQTTLPPPPTPLPGNAVSPASCLHAGGGGCVGHTVEVCWNWNSLPQHIRDSQSLTIFQSHLKTHLFSSACS
ncbi:unnamed protein product [Boreogadus saida]